MNRCVLVASLALALSVGLGCGGDDDGPAGTTGGPDGSRPGMDAGPSSSTGDAGCVHTGPPLIDPADLPVCDLCPNARCVPTAVVPMEQAERLADCDDTNKCVPELYVRTNGDFLLPTCRSIADAEGRCVSICLPDVAAQMDLLPQGSCGDDERCVPCYDPTTGEETGACGLACDPGPTEPPVMLTPCCGDLGTCIPSDSVPADQRDQLGMDACTAGALCVPDALATGTPPPACRSVADAEGRCLPRCLPDVEAQADMLPQDSCADAHLCVPCYDPISGEATGSCSLNGDMPAEPARTFPGCCDHMGTERGRCVPDTLVPMEDREGLPQDTCDMGNLCVPEPLLLDPMHTFATCTTEGFIGGGDPGACVPDCMVEGWTSWTLSQSTCADGELCAPCMNPITGADTGACR